MTDLLKSCICTLGLILTISAWAGTKVPVMDMDNKQQNKDNVQTKKHDACGHINKSLKPGVVLEEFIFTEGELP